MGTDAWPLVHSVSGHAGAKCHFRPTIFLFQRMEHTFHPLELAFQPVEFTFHSWERKKYQQKNILLSACLYRQHSK